MKLLTRIKISYFLAFICPVVLILATVVGVMKMGLNSMEQKYDLDQSSYEMILDPMSMLGHMTASTVEELEQVTKEDPDKLLDQVYLKKLNERLSNHSSYLLVKKDWQNIYSGLPKEGNYKDDLNYSPKDGKDESLYVMDEQPYHIQQTNFTFSDGSVGQVLIYTNVAQIVPQIKKLVAQIIITSLLILFAGSFIAMFWLYKSIVHPLNKLKTAAENIKDGNLNFSVAAETDDEIGEVCVAFEEMRLKLKGQIERNIQYEKESKELISNISHDLKTPMTAIKGYIEGIMDGVADTEEKRNRYIRTIYNKVNDMNSLIEELFLYAKLDSNSVTYSFAKVNVDAYFQDCVEEISLDLESQGVDFGYFNYADRDTVIIADPEQLKRVVNNIIGNSVKYASPDRKLMISLRIMEEAEFVKIEIEDNGKGIARNEVPLIFDRCYRTDASRNSSKGGSGLGLSIAKKIIEEHGGKIWAVSTEGVGTTMCFVLRKYKENNVYCKILIVEDEVAIAELEKDYLELSGFDVVMQHTGDAGLKAALNEDFNLIILDLMLPNVDGFEICKKVREKKNTPIIMVSAKKEDIDKIRGLGLGADDYMTKPFSPSELVARVKAHLARYERLVGSGVKANEIIEIRGIKIDKTARRVYVNGEEKAFTTKEFDLLTFLAENPNHVFTKEELFNKIWDMESIGDIATVTVHIKKIREKIEFNTSKPQYIETIWGVGYRFKV